MLCCANVPAIDAVPGSYPTHAVCTQQPTNGIRLTNFVEAMCPVFSRRALQICHGTFGSVSIGYGPDILWPALLGRPQTRIAVIDEIPVLHTRAPASNYNRDAANLELQLIAQRGEHD